MRTKRDILNADKTCYSKSQTIPTNLFFPRPDPDPPMENFENEDERVKLKNILWRAAPNSLMLFKYVYV
jgi:hypothetical protein